MDINKHKFFMLQLLKDIYSDVSLAGSLGFKGGTAMMFFHDLPRFSVDLDFNLLDRGLEEQVYDGIRRLVRNHGNIADEAMKFYGPVIVLDYGFGERKLKIEISNRQWGDRYEIRNLLGITMNVMTLPDMFAHKLCAILDRSEIANRDIFDSWFFMKNRTPINEAIVEQRMEMPFADYIQRCIEQLSKMPDKGMLNGLGELMDGDMKNFVKTKLRTETISLLQFYHQFPIIDS